MSGPGGAVLAAGGVICRPDPAGRTLIALVHRPAQDDWSLPKGKLDGGEAAEAAALREVREETGLVCELVRPLGRTAYVDAHGRDKVVFYWLMRPLEGRFAPNREVDELRWLTLEEALGLLSYRGDQALLAGQQLP